MAAVVKQLPVAATDVCFAADTTPVPTKTFDGVLRSKGFIWTQGSDDAYYWSHAGKRLQISSAASAPCKGQELVFIGINMDKDAIVRALDECLASDIGPKL